MNGVKVVTLKNGHVIIGSVECDQKEDFLHISIISPRVLVRMPANPEEIIPVELLGCPDKIDLYEVPLYIGDVLDKLLYSKYVKATTSLVIPN